MEKITTSIIIRAYNAETTLARAIRSALQQSGAGDFEVVIVNDGSTDGTARVAKEFLSDPRVRIIEQENQGIIGASNSGFKVARGGIVQLLDADDEATPDLISSAVAALADPTVDYAYGDYFEEFEGITKTIHPADPFKAPACAFAWRREKLLGEGGFSGDSAFPEYEILLRTWGRWRGARVETPVFIYHRSVGSMTGDSALVEASLKTFRERYPERANEIAAIRPYDL